MDRPGLLSRLGLAAIVTVVSLGVAACGGGDAAPPPPTEGDVRQLPFDDDRSGLVKPEPATDTVNRNPRGPSVNHNDPPPPIAATVRAAADAAGCKTASFNSEVAPESHTSAEAAAAQSLPPLSGAHNPRWADWGVYNRPVPYKYQLHNLEHGGVIIHYGKDVSVEAVNAIREMWAKSPAYLVVAPDTGVTPTASFPADAVVAGSHQRWLTCRPFKTEQVRAIEAFVAEYRGRGPEQIQATNDQTDRPDDLPAPEISDKGAEG